MPSAPGPSTPGAGPARAAAVGRLALALAAVLSAPARIGAQEPLAPGAGAGSDPRAFVEVVAERRTCFAGERVALALRLGVERALAERGLLQLSRRTLDLPVRVDAPWIAAPGTHGPGAVRTDAAGGGERATLALNGAEVRARCVPDVTRDGRAFVTLELDLSLRAEAPGELELGPTTLRFAWASELRDDPLLGAVAVDRRDAWCEAETVVLQVLPLPSDVRPLDFSGAVGRFTLRAEAEPRSVAVGETVQLRLAIERTDGASPGAFRAPRPDRLPGFEGFHLRGTVEETVGAARVLRYDLAPRSTAVQALPAVAFSFFDPAPPAGYRTLRTEPLPLFVRPAQAPPEEAAAEAPAEEPEPAAPSLAGPLMAALGTLFVLAFALWVLLGHRARRAHDPGAHGDRDHHVGSAP